MPLSETQFRLEPSSTRSPRAALTLIEVMIAMFILATVLMAFLGAFIQARRISESSVMHAAATSLVYGIVEQIKGLSYSDLLPSTVADPNAPVTTSPPYIRVRINQDLIVWLQTVYTTAGNAPQGPTATPPVSATAASLGAIDNVIGPLPLSSIAGATSQKLTMHMWVWVDEVPNSAQDVLDAKQITIVYTYTYNDGNNVKTVINREVFIRTPFDQ
ncbi:MAG: prepilin-type N-terminal cleavage/methylation domain-containing protein [Opitutales bacterium]